MADSRQAELAEREAAINEMIAARAALVQERRAPLDDFQPGPRPRSRHRRTSARHTGPIVDEQERRTRFLKLWAALSTPLLLSSLILILVVSPLAWLIDIAVLGGAFSGFEAIARRRFLSFLASLALFVAVVGLGVGLFLLFLRHWRIALSIVIGAAALALLIANIRTVRRH